MCLLRSCIYLHNNLLQKALEALIISWQEIHPSIHPFSKPLILMRFAGLLEPIPAVFGHQVGYTLSWLSGNRRAVVGNDQLEIAYSEAVILTPPRI